MLERAKERTAAEFGVVQAVLQAGSTVTTAECEGEPSPGQRPVTGAYKTGLWAFVLRVGCFAASNSGGTVEYELYASSRLWSRMGWSIFVYPKERLPMKIIYKDGTVAECPKEEELHVLRHTAAHIMAQAIKRLYPQADFAFGPATENGFFYDVDLGDTKLSDEDLANIEKEMKKICKENLAIKPFILRAMKL